MPRGAHARRRSLGSFTIVWTGQTISLFGDYVAYLTLPLFLAQLTESAFDFGILSAADSIPTLLLGLFGGSVLDRFRLRPVIVATELLRAAAFAVLAVFAGNGILTPLVLFAFAFVAGTLAASFNAALQAFIPVLINSQGLSTANSRLSLSQQAAFLLGPLIGGLIVKSAGFPAAFWFDAATFVVSAVSFAFLGSVKGRDLAPSDHFFAELKEGWSHLWGDARIRFTTLGGSFANFVTGFIEATLVLIGVALLGTDDPAKLGVFFVGMGAGGIVGSLSAAWVIRRIGIGRTYVTGLLAFGLGIVLLTYPTNLLGVTAVLGVGFAGLIWTNVSLITMRQLYTPARLLGRVSAAGRALAWSTAPVGALFGGVLADRFGLLTIVRAGPVLIVLFAIYLVTTPVWSARAEPVYDEEA